MAVPRQRTGHSSGLRRTDPYDDPYDPWDDYGSHEASNSRDAMRGPRVEELDRRLNPAHPYGMTGAPIPCRLCTPSEDYVCHFHRDDEESSGTG